jgi:hypothetical protein
VNLETETRRSRRTIAKRRKRWYTRWWLWLIVAVILVAIAAVAWIGVRGLQAKQQLEGAMPLVTQLKTQVLAQDSAAAKTTYAQLEPRVRKAHSLTSDPIWRAAEFVPVIGQNLKVTRTVAAQTDEVVTGAIKPLVDISGSLSLESLKPKDGRIDVGALTSLKEPVKKASASVDAALVQLNGLDTKGTFAQIATAKTQLVSLLTPVSAQLRETGSLLAIVPGMLGADGPRNYLVVFQNNGELMPAGGTIGSMAILHVENGAISLTQQSSAAPAEFPMFDEPVIPIPQDAAALYPTSLGRFVQNLTETPRFSLSFDIAKAMWKQAKGVDIDGMIAVDTVALGQLLAVTGPISLPDGAELNSANAAQTLLIGLYQNYTADQVDQINQALSGAVFSKLLSGNVDPKKLASFVATASSQHRILLWSQNAAEQNAIRNSAFYGAPPSSSVTTDALGVYFRDITPSKLAVYLKQSVALTQAVCKPGGNADVRVTVSLTNAIPPGTKLPRYVTGPDNHIQLRVSTYAPPGYTVAGVTVSNNQDAPLTGTDGEFVVSQGVVSILPGETQTVTFDLVAGHKDQRELTAKVTPAVTPTAVSTGALDCGTWSH